MEWATVYMLMYFISIVVVCLFLGFVLIYLIGDPHPRIVRFESEKYFLDPLSGLRIAFPYIADPATKALSVVVPAYNEEQRLGVMMDEALQHLEKRSDNQDNFSYEVIVVDDGSSDQTTQVAMKYSDQFGAEKVRVLRLVENRGKGGAVRLGVLASRGRHILFADADGATKFSEMDKLYSECCSMQSRLVTAQGLICGSRAHLQEESIVKRTIFRSILMYGFHALVYLFCVRGIKDTQCGFKLFARETAHLLFTNLHVERWAFDVDLLYIAAYLRVPIVEIAVKWTEIEGSKMVPVFSWLQMGRDIVLIWLRYFTGAWKICRRPVEQEESDESSRTSFATQSSL